MKLTLTFSCRLAILSICLLLLACGEREEPEDREPSIPAQALDQVHDTLDTNRERTSDSDSVME